MGASPRIEDRFITRCHPFLLFVTLMLGLLCQGLILTATAAVLPEMARDLGERGEFVAQMSVGVGAFGLTLGAVASGPLLERAGTRLLLLSALVLYAIAGGAGLVLRTPVDLLASRLVAGFSASCVTTVCLWTVAAEYSGSKRARAFGVAGALTGCAGMLSTIAGGSLAQHGGWPMAFIQYPLFGVVVLVLACVSVRQVVPQHEHGSKKPPIESRRLLPLYLVVWLLFAVTAIGGAQLPFLLKDEGLRDPATRSLVLAAPTLAAALTSFCYDSLRRVLDARETFTLAVTCLLLGLATVGWSATPSYAGTGAVLMGICVGLVGPCLYHVVADRTDERSRGRQMGWLNTAIFLGIFANPIVFAPMVDMLGAHRVFLLAAVVIGTLALPLGRSVLRPAASVDRGAKVTLV